MEKIIGSLVGVIVGFVLSQVATYMKESSVRKKERISIRNLILMELEQNINLLEDYWHDVSLSPDEDEPEENYTDRLVRRTKEIPYPPLISIVWQSHIGRLAEVLENEELKSIWRQYEIFRFLPILHERLVISDSEKVKREYGYSRASRALRTQGLTSATFNSESAALMMEYKTLITEVLENGNPLAKEKRNA
jgi:hypothetical protein